MTGRSGAYSFKPTFSIAEVPGGQWFFSSNEKKEKVEFAVEDKMLKNFNSKEYGKAFENVKNLVWHFQNSFYLFQMCQEAFFCLLFERKLIIYF